MRVRILSGVKRVTVIGPTGTGPTGSGHRVVRERAGHSSSEPFKFVVIKPTGEIERGRLHLELGPLKKDTRALRPIERGLRKLIRSEYKALGRFLVLHERSRRKRRNGWARDLGSNAIKVIRGGN
jgi:hypothetical protein